MQCLTLQAFLGLSEHRCHFKTTGDTFITEVEPGPHTSVCDMQYGHMGTLHGTTDTGTLHGTTDTGTLQHRYTGTLSLINCIVNRSANEIIEF